MCLIWGFYDSEEVAEAPVVPAPYRYAATLKIDQVAFQLVGVDDPVGPERNGALHKVSTVQATSPSLLPHAGSAAWNVTVCSMTDGLADLSTLLCLC